MISKMVWFTSVFLLALFLACAQKATSVAPEVEKIPEVVAAPAIKAGWEGEWERVKAEARKEGRVVLYTGIGTELRVALTNALKEYGIALEAIMGRGAELSERLLRERKAGIYNADLYISGLATIVEIWKPAGVLVPLEPLLILPEVKDPKLWYKGQMPFTNKEGTIIPFEAYVDHGIHINTDAIKPGEIKHMQDLLSPKWKGKIIMEDPTIPGRGQNWMSVTAIRLGEDYIRQVAKQDPLITRDKRLLIDWVAKGRYPVGLGVYPDGYQEYKRAGAPVSNLPLEEVSYLLAGISHVAYLERAPNPNASRVLLNWLLGKEGQTLWQGIRDTQSARIDTPVEHLIKAGNPIREPGVNYYDVRSDIWELEVRPKSQKIVMEIFGPLVK